MMFKVRVLQALYGLADEQNRVPDPRPAELMRFLGLDLHGRVPDARTIWLFREMLTKAKAIEVFFAHFNEHLRDRGYLAMGGHIRPDHLPAFRTGRAKAPRSWWDPSRRLLKTIRRHQAARGPFGWLVRRYWVLEHRFGRS